MEFSGLKCSGCGSSDVEFIPKTRKLICHQCGKEEYYSRATLNKNGKVIFAKDNAKKFFMNGDMENSRHYALEVLNIFMDNVPAKYIVSYYDEVKNAKNSSIKDFFETVKDIPLEYDEIRDLQELFVASARVLNDYEKEIIEISAYNMQAVEDIRELEEFIDKICPYFIKNRLSADFMKNNGAAYYEELAGRLNIPKTCFALIKSIEENPESPYVCGSFYLQSKTRYFYDNFVLAVGDILNKMKESEYKGKLLMAYEQKLNKFKLDAGY
jgi:hypothetical protein